MFDASDILKAQALALHINARFRIVEGKFVLSISMTRPAFQAGEHQWAINQIQKVFPGVEVFGRYQYFESSSPGVALFFSPTRELTTAFLSKVTRTHFLAALKNQIYESTPLLNTLMKGTSNGRGTEESTRRRLPDIWGRKHQA